MTKTRTGMTRRGFVQNAAALVVPAFVPSTVFGRMGRPAPSDRITLGFIGMGTQMRGHLRRSLKNPATQVVASQALADYQRFTSEGRMADAGQSLEDLRQALEELNLSSP